MDGVSLKIDLQLLLITKSLHCIPGGRSKYSVANIIKNYQICPVYNYLNESFWYISNQGSIT